MENLIKELLDFCEKRKLEVKDDPRTEKEVGFKLATISFCSQIRRMANKYKEVKSEKESFTIDEFHEMLNKIELDNKE